MIGLEDVMTAVTAETGITAEQIEGRSREEDIVLARHVYIYLCREMVMATNKEIAQSLGMNLSSMVHVRKKLSNDAFLTKRESDTLDGVRHRLEFGGDSLLYKQAALLGMAYHAARPAEFQWAISSLK